MKNKKIAFIGGGNMAQSIINGLIKAGYDAKNIIVSTPHPEKVTTLTTQYGILGTTSNLEAINQSDVVVLAVKPQVASEALATISNDNIELTKKLIISVMAGITVASIMKLLPGAQEIIRIMPNTPALIGYGMAGLFASSQTSAENREFADNLMRSCGKTIWVKTEGNIDDITALSGSAPAYFFRFMECMAKVAKDMGFNDKESRTILEQVALGATQMVIQNPQKNIAELRAAVTSKGGTTYEALKIFDEAGLEQIVANALTACKVKAQEMSKQY